MSDLPGTTDRGELTPPSQLFMVRLWLEQLGEGQTEWRGQVRHVASDTACYFRDWQTLVKFIHEMLLDREV